MAFIEVKDLRYSYETEEGSLEVLHGVSLDIEAGEFVALLGHNGCGKSTMAKLLNGMYTPSGGTLAVDGISAGDESRQLDLRRRVGLVLQNPDNQLVAGVVEEDVAFGPENLGVPPQEIRKRVDEALKAVDMYHYRAHAPHKLSGGQKQRVAIAGVIAMEPKVLILDEPTAGLDPKGRDHILGQIVGYHKETGRTVLIVSHSMEDVAKFANKVLVMNQSRMFCYDDVKNVFSRSEEIAGMGLAVPQITRVFVELARRGYPVDPGVYTVEQAKKQVMELMKGGEPA